MEESDVPLTRSKGSKPEQVITKPEPVPPPVESQQQVKPAKEKKPRAPKTQAQLEAFQKAMEKRKINIELKKQEKKVEASKILLENEKLKETSKPAVKRIRKPKTVVVEESSSEDEPNVVYIKKRSSRKKKKIIVQSETESETEAEPEIEIKHRESFGKSHQNKKTVKTTITQVDPNKKSYHNFFTD